MGALVLKYVQILCVSFFLKSSNCKALVKVSEDANNFKLAACMAECLKYQTRDTFDNCYDHCTTAILESEKMIDFKNETNSSFDLYCRDSRKLMIQIQNEAQTVDDDTFIYMLVVQESTGKYIDRLVYYSDENLIRVTVDDLTTNESTTLSYNISAYIVFANATIQELGMRMFTTLMSNYTPETIRNIFPIKWYEKVDEETDEGYLNLELGWESSNDNTCNYDVVYAGEELDIGEIGVPFHSLRRMTIPERLQYDEEYSFAVRGKNSQHEYIQGNISWVKIKSPSCSAKECKILPKMKIYNFTIEFHDCGDRRFNINATWRTSMLPEHLVIYVRDADHNNHNISHEPVELDGSINSYQFKNVLIMGSSFSVNLTAYAGNQSDTDIEYILLPIYSTDRVGEILVYSLIAIMFLLSVALCKVWKGRIDSYLSAMAQKRLENMDLEAVKTMSKGTLLESIAELTKDELMEVEREGITMLELLGEGAFGLVNKALLIRNGEKQYVAVKMLKNTNNCEDIRQFLQEIAVMKSVGQHENIVSIVGHSTSDIKCLMLITEYCDSGNLLDILRQELEKQRNFFDKKYLRHPRTPLQKYHDSLLNFDMMESDKKEISYKNISGCSTVVADARLFVVNQMYDELNNNGEQALKVIDEMTATNALYLELNDRSSVAIEIPEKNDFSDDFLTSSDLISFAKQIADGMDFLASKKVVHRDLAARNILICSNKVVKISDFGLSRDIYQENEYRKTGNGKLPIKWLALESMTHQVYTSQSDVWSFGILLYEIVTLGELPYSSIEVKNLVKELKSGYRMERPYHCHRLLYELMMLCWQANPLERPSFSVLAEKLQNFLTMENSWGERIIDLQRMFDKCTSEMNYMKPLA